jgi:hypothetical protein
VEFPQTPRGRERLSLAIRPASRAEYGQQRFAETDHAGTKSWQFHAPSFPRKRESSAQRQDHGFRLSASPWPE